MIAHSKPPVPVRGWVIVIKSKRSRWIHWHTFSLTRKRAWAKLAEFRPVSIGATAERATLTLADPPKKT